MLAEFAQIIANCATPDSAGEAFRREVARHGFTSSACRAVVPSGEGRKSRVLFREWSEDWAKLSEERNFAAKSFVLRDAGRRIAPFTWLDAEQERKLTAGEREVLDTAADWGWNNGFVVPVHGPSGYFATVSMGSPERDLDLSPDGRMRLYMVALLAHERCLALIHPFPANNPGQLLGARELECLRWVAAGKTDWEIGVILSISAATVKFHVDRARQKLDARSRTQAVAQLALCGLL